MANGIATGNVCISCWIQFLCVAATLPLLGMAGIQTRPYVCSNSLHLQAGLFCQVITEHMTLYTCLFKSKMEIQR